MSSIFGKVLGSLFGGSNGEGGTPDRAEPVEYGGCKIYAAPRKDSGQWLTAGLITKEIGEETKEHHFIRADRHGSREDAESFSVTKAKQIIDEQKDALFDD